MNMTKYVYMLKNYKAQDVATVVRSACTNKFMQNLHEICPSNSISDNTINIKAT